MSSITKKRQRADTKKKHEGRNGKAKSFRKLKAFGLWADRSDVKDPVEFAKALRRKMEQGRDRTIHVIVP